MGAACSRACGLQKGNFESRAVERENSELSPRANPEATGYTTIYHVPKVSHRLAAAKLTRGLSHKDRGHTVNVECGSVYGIVILLPQLARTAGWTRELTSRTIASCIMLILCILLHAYLLKFIAKEEKVMDGFGGQMYLCDFGAHIQGCEGDECLGPGGTRITGPRLYSFSAWVARGFVRDSLKSLFPDMKDDIDVVADPGEYGLESYNCRILCVTIFVISIMPEMRLCRDMARLLFYIPSQNEPWIELEGDAQDHDDAETCLSKVKVKVAGMSYTWKALNFCLVLLPKVALLYMTANAGVAFLMETAGMDDIIVNCVALCFLLTMDELIVDALLNSSSDMLTEKCEEFDYLENSEARILGADDTMQMFHDKHKTDNLTGCCKLLAEMLFIRCVKIALVFATTAFFVGKYYWEHCDYKGGQYVSKPVSAPLSTNFGFVNMFHGFTVPQEETPFWTMPEPSG